MMTMLIVDTAGSLQNLNQCIRILYFVSFLHLQKYIDDGWEVGRKLKYQILKTESSFKKPLAQQLCKQESLQYNEF